MADFVKDHKSLVNEANENRENMNVLERLCVCRSHLVDVDSIQICTTITG
jgi:hypothetical protein